VFAKARVVRGFLAVAATLALLPALSSAHPMGNFSISHYAGITIDGRFVEVRYLIDMAEIPTFQEIQQNSIVAQSNDPRVRSYLSSQAEAFKTNLLLTLNGQPLSLETTSQDILFSPGAGNLPTMKFGLVYRAQVSESCAVNRCELEYRDANFSGRLGWKEVIISPGRGVTIQNSSVTSHDRSSQLSNYPTDLVNSPPQDVAAKIVYSVERSPSGQFTPAIVQAKTAANPPAAISRTAISPANPHPALPSHAMKDGTSRNAARISVQATFPPAANSLPAPLQPNHQSTPRNSFTELMAIKQISFTIALLAAAIAAGLGALHALEPGHGKTIVAAYLVGSKGTARHALLLGMIVTVSHTAGVYLLGAITLSAQKYILPDRIYPFLGVLSGALIAGMGCYLFLQRYLGGEFAHEHGDEISETREVSTGGTRRQLKKVSTRQLLVLGVTGGIVPCPAALVVLLSAVALHRTSFGLFLIVAFSIGLAAVLIAMGLAAVYAGNMIARLRLEGPLVQRWLPMASAAMIILLGLSVAMRGLVSAGIVQIRMWS
jgi:ABC-type nickel/cobalt efflux system permease component RcnA